MKPEYEPKTQGQKFGYLIEECGEVLAALGKTQRWGLESVNPELPQEEQETNRAWLLRELDDLECAICYVRESLAESAPPCTHKENDGGRYAREMVDADRSPSPKQLVRWRQGFEQIARELRQARVSIEGWRMRWRREGNRRSELEAELAAARSAPVASIPMLLFCPACGVQHIDEPDERTPGWTNPPHRSHLCHGCGHIWRPADVATEGVAAIQTRGANDSPLAIPLRAPELRVPEGLSGKKYRTPWRLYDDHVFDNEGAFLFRVEDHGGGVLYRNPDAVEHAIQCVNSQPSPASEPADGVPGVLTYDDPHEFTPGELYPRGCFFCGKEASHPVHPQFKPSTAREPAALGETDDAGRRKGRTRLVYNKETRTIDKVQINPPSGETRAERPEPRRMTLEAIADLLADIEPGAFAIGRPSIVGQLRMAIERTREPAPSSPPPALTMEGLRIDPTPLGLRVSTPPERGDEGELRQLPAVAMQHMEGCVYASLTWHVGPDRKIPPCTCPPEHWQRVERAIRAEQPTAPPAPEAPPDA